MSRESAAAEERNLHQHGRRPATQRVVQDARSTPAAGEAAAGVLGPDNIAVPNGTSGERHLRSSTATQNNAVNKVTEDRLIPAGAVTRQTISVAVSQAAAGGLNLASLKNLVTSAAGVDTKRGDVVTVEVVPFSTAAADNAAKALAEAQANAEAKSSKRSSAPSSSRAASCSAC